MTKASTSKRTRPMTAKNMVIQQASDSRLSDFKNNAYTNDYADSSTKN